jgi:hypothetical protein
VKYRIALIAIAVAAALVPLPQHLVEERYSRGIYASLQSVLTPLSNRLPVPLLDVVALGALVIAAGLLWRSVRARGIRSALSRATLGTLAVAAVVYLVFLATWGFNYQRVPLEQKLDFQIDRINGEAAVGLFTTAVQRVNAGHAAAHQGSLRMGALEEAFIDAQQVLGARRLATPGRAKHSLLQVYFRSTAISGMTVPGFLEVLLNSDLLPVEVPFTLTHEWAHLAGYADESEANFLAWLACVRSPDPLLQYSGWLETVGLAARGLPRTGRYEIPKLADGPRQDLHAINDRLGRSSPRARTVSRGVYDSYLKANRVEEGIHSYDAALRLMLGTTFDDRWRPVLRPH